MIAVTWLKTVSFSRCVSYAQSRWIQDSLIVVSSVCHKFLLGFKTSLSQGEPDIIVKDTIVRERGCVCGSCPKAQTGEKLRVVDQMLARKSILPPTLSASCTSRGSLSLRKLGK